MIRFFFHKIVLAVILCLTHITDLHAQDGYVKGRVSNGIENLEHATVSFGNKVVITDHKGEFSFSSNPGIYNLAITHTGYKKVKREIKIESDSTWIVDIIMSPVEQLGEVVVLGSRSGVQRSNLNTPVPVDAFSSGQLLQTGQPGLIQMLNFIAPSFNASRQVSNEPVTLRSLDPEHTLIMLNGTRYHNTAWLNKGNNRSSLGSGSAGNDLNSIPFSAIEKIEILCDGSSAQFGSDAIAGVINIQLKESIGKTSVQLHSGQHYKGDGDNFVFGINHGISLNKKGRPGGRQGFLNFSGDFRFRGRTNRGGIHEGTVYYNIPANASQALREIIITQDNRLVEERKFNRYIPAGHVGNSQLMSYGILANGAYTISNQTKVFLTAAINERIVNGRGAYRFPKSPNQVDTALFPNGFQVRSITYTLDISGIAGIKGVIKNNWHWELSSSYGYNSANDFSENTNNPSLSYLGKNAPTTFYGGKLVYSQLTNNIDIVKRFDHVLKNFKSLNLGFGAEWRLENYHTIAGEEASWKNYDTINKKLNGGAQGAVGIMPVDVVNKNRNVVGAYIDIESELDDHLLLNLSCRYEYYNDFGGNIAGKIAARYKFSNKFSFRGSISNGFRAPALQQRYQSSTLTAWARSGGAIIPAIRGIFPENHEVTRALGIPLLKAENTINISVGFTSSLFNHITMTFDAYSIQIKNRVILSGIFERLKIVALDNILDNYPDQSQVDQVQFFTNAINTRTKGIDIVLNGKWKKSKSAFGFTLAANFNKTTIFGDIKTSDKLSDDSLIVNTLFDTYEKTRIEKGQPSSKIILSLNYQRGKLGFVLINTQFGRTTSSVTYTDPNRTLFEYAAPKILTDLSINYTFTKLITLTAGANNILDVYPTRLKYYENTRDGILRYSQDASPFGYNGGYYFVRMSLHF